MSNYWLDWQALNVRDTELALSHLSYWVNHFADQNIEFGLRLPNVTIDIGTGDVLFKCALPRWHYLVG
ncbi:MAG: hypothetical protein U5M23_12005 [Marinagarivorans sp.]|nr:hypothetical protein [Marinagarivorans sp.]